MPDELIGHGAKLLFRLIGWALTAPPADEEDGGHAQTARYCFAEACDLMAQPTRTIRQRDEMLQLAHTSLWHTSQRKDRTSEMLVIGYWQVSRVYAMLDAGQLAMRHARRCLDYIDQIELIYVAYAHEAVARAARMLDDESTFREHLAKAHAAAKRVTDRDKVAMIAGDIEALADRL